MTPSPRRSGLPPTPGNSASTPGTCWSAATGPGAISPPRGRCRRDGDGPKLAGQVLIYPATDFAHLQGRSSRGDLSFRESQKLQQGQARVQNLENKAKANGVVTPLERARIHAAQNIQSARIFLKRHN